MKGDKIMTYSILLVVPKPDGTDDETLRKWGAAIDHISDIIQRNKEIQALGENVLLIPLDNTLDALGEAIRRMKDVDYKYLILEQEEIVWHQVSKKT
jgi:hypothetical protein